MVQPNPAAASEAQPARKTDWTEEEYLAFEVASPMRHEYVRGEIFAMSGVADRHNDVTGNVYAALKAHLRGGGCRAYFVDIKLQVAKAKAYFYPDVFVTCDPADHADTYVKRHAKLVIEVVSPSTAEYDRTDKFRDYRQLESLEEYAIVDTRSRRVDVYRHRPDGIWEFDSAVEDETILLRSIELRLALATVYDQTDIPMSLPRPVIT